MQLSAVVDPHSDSWDVAIDGSWLGDGPGGLSVIDLPDVDIADLNSARVVIVVLEDGESCVLAARRPTHAKGQDRDEIEVRFSGLEGSAQVLDPRLSTEYSAAGAVRRFGVELWIGEDPEGDQRPVRFGGEGDGAPRETAGAVAFPMHAHGGELTGRGIYVLLTR